MVRHFASVFILLLLAGRSADTQPQDRAVIEESYYKIKGGLTAEWLNLYKKNHLSILRELQKERIIESIELYEISYHRDVGGYNYKAILRLKNWSALDEMNKRFDKVRETLFPDKAAFDKEESRRWEITEHHWDDVIRPVQIQ